MKELPCDCPNCKPERPNEKKVPLRCPRCCKLTVYSAVNKVVKSGYVCVNCGMLFINPPETPWFARGIWKYLFWFRYLPWSLDQWLKYGKSIKYDDVNIPDMGELMAQKIARDSKVGIPVPTGGTEAHHSSEAGEKSPAAPSYGKSIIGECIKDLVIINEIKKRNSI